MKNLKVSIIFIVSTVGLLASCTSVKYVFIKPPPKRFHVLDLRNKALAEKAREDEEKRMALEKLKEQKRRKTVSLKPLAM